MVQVVASDQHVSKFLQAENMDIDVALKQLKRLILFLEDFSEFGFDRAIVEFKQIASDKGIEASCIMREKKKSFEERINLIKVVVIR